MTKLTDKPLMSACANPDGRTYNGVTALRWLHECMTGKSLSEEEALKIAERGKQLAEQKRMAR